jgi:hypothetical protein
MRKVLRALFVPSLLLPLGLLTGLSSCVVAQPAAAPSNFEECIAAGNPMLKSYPARCVAHGKTFVQEVPRPSREIGTPKGAFGGGCKSQCGDGTCQEVVCMAVGCPCPESPQTCSEDCKILQ